MWPWALGTTSVAIVSLYLGGQIAMRAFAYDLMHKHPDLAEELHRREHNRKENA